MATVSKCDLASDSIIYSVGNGQINRETWTFTFQKNSATLAQSLASRLAIRVTIYEEQLVIVAMF